MYFLTASHIVKRYAEHVALDDVSIQVPRGKVFGLLGPNGAGKTTLIRIINRITAPDSGEVIFDGHPFAPEDVARIGYLPEERGLYKKMKVGEQAIYLARLKGLTAAEAKERLTYWFNKFEIMPWWDKKLEELSKGMQQKVQFIITILHEPPLLIFDEPFSGFDPVNADLLKREILELRDKGHTVIFSTHNMSSVEEVCDDIALINHSRVVLSGNVQEVKSRFRTGIYEVVTPGEIMANPTLYELCERQTRSGLNHYRLKVVGDTANATLIAALAQQVDIRTFRECVPSMHDIFIQTVGADAATPETNNAYPLPAMSKIWIIIQREFMTRVKKKSFILLTILMPFIFAALIMVPLMLATIEGDEQKTVMVVDKTGRYVGSLKSTPNYAFVPTADNKDEFYTEDSEVEAVVQITADLAKNPTAVTIYSPREVKAELLSYVETCLGEQVRREKLSAYNIPELETIIADIQTDFHVATVKRNAEGDETSSNTYIAMTAGFIFTFLIYMFVMSYGGMVMQSVMEEKTNRIVELMVSSVKPFQLMMGKIIGVALVGFVQLAIWGVMLSIILMVCGSVFGLSAAPAVPAVAGADAQMAAVAQQAGGGEAAEIMSALMGLPYAELGIMFVLYFVGGYLLYASFFAAVGASINAQEDSSQFIMPVVLIMVFGLYAAMYSAENTNGPLAFWASIFPLTSPIVMMVRIPFGVPWWEEVLSLGLLFATSMAFVWISARIYRVGILMYGKKPSLREMLKWVRWR